MTFLPQWSTEHFLEGTMRAIQLGEASRVDPTWFLYILGARYILLYNFSVQIHSKDNFLYTCGDVGGFPSQQLIGRQHIPLLRLLFNTLCLLKAVVYTQSGYHLHSTFFKSIFDWLIVYQISLGIFHTLLILVNRSLSTLSTIALLPTLLKCFSFSMFHFYFGFCVFCCPPD